MDGFTLFLLRHGKAIPRGTPGVADAARRLTPGGVRATRRAARAVRSLTGRVDRLLASPLPRARETARIVARDPRRIETLPALSPGRGPKGVWEALTRGGKGRRFLLVGHEPDLSELVAWLTGIRPSGIAFRKGGLARVDLPEAPARRTGTLRWLVTPRILRKLSERKPS